MKRETGREGAKRDEGEKKPLRPTQNPSVGGRSWTRKLRRRRIPIFSSILFAKNARIYDGSRRMTPTAYGTFLRRKQLSGANGEVGIHVRREGDFCFFRRRRKNPQHWEEE